MFVKEGTPGCTGAKANSMGGINKICNVMNPDALSAVLSFPLTFTHHVALLGKRQKAAKNERMRRVATLP